MRKVRPVMVSRPVPQDSSEEPTEKRRDRVSAGADDTVASGPRASSTPLDSPLPPLEDARYQVEPSATALLGSGGQGAVWRAKDQVLRREVALKKLHPEAQADPAQLAAFLREARLTALLEHPGIVPLHDVGRSPDGTAAIVMRRIEGSSLAETLAKTRTLDERLALVPAVLRACQAVAFAHEHHVVHRDLKPQNIMLGSFGETYVLDWGLAYVDLEGAAPGAPDVTAPHQVSGVVGTPAYMSPEQALGLAADARSDVWGLGTCLYQVLTGQPPITGRSLASAMGHAASAEVAPVLALEPSAPADLAAICEKCLSLERGARYPTAVALARDLESWLAGRTVSARSYSRWELLKRALLANRAVVTVVALALLALGVGLGLDEARVRRERNEARLFARDLLRDLPTQVETKKPNIALISMLTARAQQWLSRSDLSGDELADACDVLIQLGAFNADTRQWAEADRLARQAIEMGRRGGVSFPGVAALRRCEVEGLTSLGYATIERGDEDAGVRRYEEAEARLRTWPGEPHPQLQLAGSSLYNTWGSVLWGRSPKGAEYFITAAKTALPLIADPEIRVRRAALTYGANGAAALWSQGRRQEGLEMARHFYEGATRSCAADDLRDQRSCLSATQSYASLLAWEDDPKAADLRRRAAVLLALVLEQDSDSVTTRYDAMLAAFEAGDFERAHVVSLELRERKAEAWTVELGPLAAVLSGHLDEVDRSQALAGEGVSGHRLAQGLRDAARGDYAAAARALRRVEPGTLWFALSWTPHPAPALKLPPAAQPAFERFLAEFTRAYGAADMPAIDASVEHLASALDAL